MPVCDCGCCRVGCPDCHRECTSWEAQPIEDDGYQDYLAARAA